MTEEPGADLPHIPPRLCQGKGTPLPSPGQPELLEGCGTAHVLQQAVIKMPVGQPRLLHGFVSKGSRLHLLDCCKAEGHKEIR
ncbi:unnamed protein product [Caretta caretta]